jgi:hypothetical protein
LPIDILFDPAAFVPCPSAIAPEFKERELFPIEIALRDEAVLLDPIETESEPFACAAFAGVFPAPIAIDEPEDATLLAPIAVEYSFSAWDAYPIAVVPVA